MGRYKVDYAEGDLIPLEDLMIGATDTEEGSGGITPTPSAHFQDRLLGGDAQWQKSEFIGTLEEWNNLSIEDKLQFKTADIYKKKYTITYKANNGVGSDIVITRLEDSAYVLIDSPFTTVDRVFQCWNTESDGSGIDYQPGDVIHINNNITLWAKWDWIALKFSSDTPFTLSVTNPSWDGTLEYTTDGGNIWTTWDGSQLSGTATQSIYLRGIENTKITGSYDAPYAWTFTGKYCTGNIETLLDYQTVINGQHPTMGDFCYARMFYSCVNLLTAPELPATTLSVGCYQTMFDSCSALTEAPVLPATTMKHSCYANMFYKCSALTTAPELPATTLAENCYASIFRFCYTLITVPTLPATTIPDTAYYHMFEACYRLKLSETQTDEYQFECRIPAIGTGTIEGRALEDMFTRTGGTFTGTPTINTTYYTDHQPV